MSGSKEAIFAGSVVPFQPSGKRPSIMCTSSWSAKVSAGYGGRAQFGTGTEKSALGDVAHRLGALFEMGEKLVEFSLSTLAHAAQKQSQQRGQRQFAVAGKLSPRDGHMKMQSATGLFFNDRYIMKLFVLTKFSTKCLPVL